MIVSEHKIKRFFVNKNGQTSSKMSSIAICQNYKVVYTKSDSGHWITDHILLNGYHLLGSLSIGSKFKSIKNARKHVTLEICESRKYPFYIPI